MTGFRRVLFRSARGEVQRVPLIHGEDFFESISQTVKTVRPKPRVLIISFPNNPTTSVVDLNFFKDIVELAREFGLMVVHDFAYADLCFDGYKAPSFLEAPGAKEVGVEFYSLSKSYSMPGWRVGFMVGNSRVISALKRVKSYLDYGIFQPIQIASILALNGPQDCVSQIRDRKSTRLNSSHMSESRMPSSA